MLYTEMPPTTMAYRQRKTLKGDRTTTTDLTTVFETAMLRVRESCNIVLHLGSVVQDHYEKVRLLSIARLSVDPSDYVGPETSYEFAEKRAQYQKAVAELRQYELELKLAEIKHVELCRDEAVLRNELRHLPVDVSLTTPLRTRDHESLHDVLRRLRIDTRKRRISSRTNKKCLRCDRNLIAVACDDPSDTESDSGGDDDDDDTQDDADKDGDVDEDDEADDADEDELTAFDTIPKLVDVHHAMLEEQHYRRYNVCDNDEDRHLNTMRNASFAARNSRTNLKRASLPPLPRPKSATMFRLYEWRKRCNPNTETVGISTTAVVVGTPTSSSCLGASGWYSMQLCTMLTAAALQNMLSELAFLRQFTPTYMSEAEKAQDEQQKQQQQQQQANGLRKSGGNDAANVTKLIVVTLTGGPLTRAVSPVMLEFGSYFVEDVVETLRFFPHMKRLTLRNLNLIDFIPKRVSASAVAAAAAAAAASGTEVRFRHPSANTNEYSVAIKALADLPFPKKLCELRLDTCLFRNDTFRHWMVALNPTLTALHVSESKWHIGCRTHHRVGLSRLQHLTTFTVKGTQHVHGIAGVLRRNVGLSSVVLHGDPIASPSSSSAMAVAAAGKASAAAVVTQKCEVFPRKLEAALRHLNRLVHLELANYTLLDEQMMRRWPITMLPRLTSLTVQDVTNADVLIRHLGDASTGLSDLQHLSATRCYNSLSLDRMQHCPRLRTISLTDWVFVNTGPTVLYNFERLVHIYMMRPTFYDDADLIDLLRNMPQLTTLTLDMVEFLGDAATAAIIGEYRRRCETVAKQSSALSLPMRSAPFELMMTPGSHFTRRYADKIVAATATTRESINRQHIESVQKKVEDSMQFVFYPSHGRETLV